MSVGSTRRTPVPEKPRGFSRSFTTHGSKRITSTVYSPESAAINMSPHTLSKAVSVQFVGTRLENVQNIIFLQNVGSTTEAGS